MNLAMIEIIRRFKTFVASQTPAANQIPVVKSDGSTALPGPLSLAGKLTVANTDSNDSTAIDYALRATFTGTLTGFSGTAPSGTCSFSRVNRQIVLEFPNLSSSNNNATTMTMTGAPVEMRPLISAKTFIARVVDNGTSVWGLATIGTNGVITFNKDANASAFTNTGTKGLTQFNGATFNL